MIYRPGYIKNLKSQECYNDHQEKGNNKDVPQTASSLTEIKKQNYKHISDKCKNIRVVTCGNLIYRNINQDTVCVNSFKKLQITEERFKPITKQD